MKKVIVILSLGIIITSVHAQQQAKTVPAKPQPVKPAVNPLKDMKDSVSYAIGLNIAKSLMSQDFTDVNTALLNKAMNDVLQNKKTNLTDEAASKVINQFMDIENAKRAKANSDKAAANKLEGKKFLEANAKRAGVFVLPSGIQYEVITKGTDTIKPKLTDTVKCNYKGTLIDGMVFDSSSHPVTFPLGNVIKGWQESLQLMTVGSKWKLYIPSNLAYGDRAAGKIEPGSTLIFDVELLSIEK